MFRALAFGRMPYGEHVIFWSDYRDHCLGAPVAMGANGKWSVGPLAVLKVIEDRGAASIAMLPLTNESGQASHQHFSEGISEDLITALSQFPGLKVIGRPRRFSSARRRRTAAASGQS
jgi:hypothetical protein